MATPRNPQDQSQTSELEKPLIRPLDEVSPPMQGKTFDYRVVPIDLSSAAIINLEFEMQGEKIYYMEGQSRLQIKIGHRTKDNLDLYPGRKIVCPFQRFYVSAPQADEIIKLIVASPNWVQMHGEGVEVNTLIRDKSLFRETELKRAFTVYGTKGNLAANYSLLQLWNPATSGVIAIVRSARPESAAAGRHTLHRHNAALTDLISVGQNKYIAEATSTCEMRSVQNAAFLGTLLLGNRLLNDESRNFLEGDEILLSPSYGIIMSSTTVDQYFSGSFQWLELPLGDISGF